MMNDTAPAAWTRPMKPEGNKHFTLSPAKKALNACQSILECCLFIFLDGSAYYFDDFMRKLTGYYRLMYGSVNGHPHYVARNCKDPDEYGTSCTYIWFSG